MPTLATYDALDVPASNEEINATRDELEVAPVSVLGYLVDIDEKAEKRMTDAIALWETLNVTSVDWTMADNTVHALTKPELVSLLAAAKQARGLRALVLHQEARAFKQNGATLRDLEDWKEQA